LLGFAGLRDAERAQRYPDLHGVDVGAPVGAAQARTARDERGILFNYGTPSGGVGPNGPAPDNTARAVIRGVHDGRYKFGRYFKISEHHIPRDWETLVARNDLELYDTAADPDEIVNLAAQPAEHRQQILALNAKINALLEREVGADDGAMYPGPTSAYGAT
jgi:arylsulfatase